MTDRTNHRRRFLLTDGSTLELTGMPDAGPLKGIWQGRPFGRTRAIIEKMKARLLANGATDEDMAEVRLQATTGTDSWLDVAARKLEELSRVRAVTYDEHPDMTEERFLGLMDRVSAIATRALTPWYEKGIAAVIRPPPLPRGLAALGLGMASAPDGGMR